MATVVVSGLPRSGTSLLMQILAAGGVPTLVDHRRPPDPNNPKGYLEHEAVKGLKSDPSVLDGSEGHAVKVVAMLLPHLPPDRQYSVLFMHRDLDEVIASQRKMIERLGKPAVAIDDRKLRDVLSRQVAQALAWCSGTPGVDSLEIKHRSLVLDPGEQVAAICDFLGGPLDRDAMLAVPEPSLYRQRG